MQDFTRLWDGGPLFAAGEAYPISTDCVLLADFVRLNRTKRGIDLGCASGIIGLLLLEKNSKLHMTGLELVAQGAELARLNMEENGFQDRSDIICGDIREHRKLFKSGSFDLVVANPPYFPVERGAQSPDELRSTARGEGTCSLKDICAAAAFLCRTGGSFCLVHKPERLSELFCALSTHGLEPKRLRLVQHAQGSAPNLVLVEARRGGKPGLIVEPNLILRNADGSESQEVKQIYHR